MLVGKSLHPCNLYACRIMMCFVLTWSHCTKRKRWAAENLIGVWNGLVQHGMWHCSDGKEWKQIWNNLILMRKILFHSLQLWYGRNQFRWTYRSACFLELYFISPYMLMIYSNLMSYLMSSHWQYFLLLPDNYRYQTARFVKNILRIK